MGGGGKIGYRIIYKRIKQKISVTIKFVSGYSAIYLYFRGNGNELSHTHKVKTYCAARARAPRWGGGKVWYSVVYNILKGIKNPSP